MIGLDLEQGLRGAPVLRGSHLHYPVIFALLDPDPLIWLNPDPKHWIQWPNLMNGLDLEQGLRGAPVLRGSHLLSGRHSAQDQHLDSSASTKDLQVR
jgi:hypothetical protein